MTEAVPTSALQGWLSKRGKKGVTKGWKRRWFVHVGDELQYYVTPDDAASLKGSISLSDILSVTATAPANKATGKTAFQINTPPRIYQLMADNEEAMRYWVEGIDSAVKRREGVDQNRQKEGWNLLTKRLETEIRRLRRALEITCDQLNVTPESMLLKADSEVDEEQTMGSASDPTNLRPFKAEALYEFEASHEEQISLSVGCIITVDGKYDGGWWAGTDTNGKRGFFPGAYVQPMD
mmetsp:Transcript_4272/g.11934  ORF Transcript_4272/g.11934 Transcript_4272/m.11934 type:complete len:237 (+) Transcript_4272:244-954(+)|eukprot:CAMPEP_0119122324 /NCGR_PEP_ID=MMETSP1310-20130426/2615_1 /TAXON_ID=464262 /ORGANISM="Genus nov. species nov., Strain RCC2339" /LENGTH=236 /DNA_ID=CAMNT_0007111963 /DNA_START=240 /DNA_END=950 /DNA_ORIENTATION=-